MSPASRHDVARAMALQVLNGQGIVTAQTCGPIVRWAFDGGTAPVQGALVPQQYIARSAASNALVRIYGQDGLANVPHEVMARLMMLGRL
jgi:hypothetical protein